MEYVKKIVGKHHVAVIEEDQSYDNPMDYYNFLGRLYVPNCRYLSSTCDEDYFNQADVKVPIYMYAHSGVTINTTGFSCPWDSGQIGWICVSKEDVLDEYCRKRFTDKLRNIVEERLIKEVGVVDCWLTGEVYGFTVYKLNNVDDEPPYDDSCWVDSCWGFCGLDWCIANATDEVKMFDKSEDGK